MLCGIASPIALLEPCAGLGSYHLALSHLILTSPEYRAFYLKESRAGKLLGVDNGLVEEGESLPLSDVLEAARLVEATEIVLPDVLEDGEASLNATLEGLEEYDRLGHPGNLHLIGVPHGYSAADWMISYLHLVGDPRIDIIGISMFDSPLFEGGRVGLLNQLEDLDLINLEKPYHMLGCWKDIREAHGLSTQVQWHDFAHGGYLVPRIYVRSMDTGLPVRWGVQGLSCPDLNEAVEPPVATHRSDNFQAHVEMTPAVEWNLRLYRACCCGKAPINGVRPT